TDSDRVNRTSVVAGGDVEVSALNRERVKSIAVGGGGGFIGLAGSVAAAEISSVTEAFISEADVRAANDLRVLANSGSELDEVVGALAAGSGGLGVSIVVPTIGTSTRAHLTGAGTNAGRTTEVRADSSESVDFKVGTLGVGLAGLAGAVGV